MSKKNQNRKNVVEASEVAAEPITNQASVEAVSEPTAEVAEISASADEMTAAPVTEPSADAKPVAIAAKRGRTARVKTFDPEKTILNPRAGSPSIVQTIELSSKLRHQVTQIRAALGDVVERDALKAFYVQMNWALWADANIVKNLAFQCGQNRGLYCLAVADAASLANAEEIKQAAVVEYLKKIESAKNAKKSEQQVSA